MAKQMYIKHSDCKLEQNLKISEIRQKKSRKISQVHLYPYAFLLIHIL